MNGFYDYYSPGEQMENAVLIAAEYLINLGFKVLPCTGKVPVSSIRSVNKLRQRPIHAQNVTFYFADNPNVAILTGDNLELIDIDCKYDLTGKLYKQVANAIRYTMPDVWEKLVVQRTSTKGYHLLYRCAQIGGNATLAQRLATADEMEHGERKKTLIETRGEGGYAMVSPTPGYEFIQGNPSEIGEITIDQRAELMAICRSFNKINEVDLPGISKSKQTDPTSPWNVFNEKHGWEFIRDELTKAGWETLREDDDRIFVLRPGAQSKTSGAIWKESNMLFLFSTSTEFPDKKPVSAFDIVRYFKYDGDIIKAAKGLAETGYGNFMKDEGEFYTINDQGQVNHSLRAIITWMHDIGIRRYFTSKKDFEVVHVLDNKVCIIDHNHLKKLLGDYIHSTCDKKIDEYFLRKIPSIFSKENLINFIEKLDDNFLTSTSNTSWLFYQNNAIMVTKDKVIFYEYNSLPGYVWENSIIKRNIYFDASDCEARVFIGHVSNDQPQPFESAIGYMLHGYKDAANPRCVILYDEFFDESKEEREPEGGTGKGIFIKMLSKFRNTIIIDGKTWNNQKSFPYQQLGPDSEIVAFEDVRKNFDFESLFSIITDDWTIEKKNMTAFSISFDRSPKIIITSNYPLRGTSKSHLRRRFELEVSSYYNTENTIQKEFGHRFFTDWNEKEWIRFDNYFIECLQFYLKESLQDAENKNLGKSRLLAETNTDFLLWMKEFKPLPSVITKEDMLQKFTDKFPDYRTGKRAITQTLFTRWMRKYCDHFNLDLDSRNDYNGKMCYRFGTQGPTDEEELPF